MIRPLRIASLALVFLLPLLPALAQPAGSRTSGSRTNPSRPANTQKDKDRAVAIVNGQKIPFKYYEDLYADQIAYQRRIGGPDQVEQGTDDAMFLQLIEAELTRQEAARRKVKVTRDQAIQALLKNPPDFIREAFIDDKGNFQNEIFRQVVLHPDMIGRMAGGGGNADEVTAQWKADLDKVIAFMQTQETKRLLQDKLFAQKPLTSEQIRRRYIAERTRFDGSFIRVLHSTVPDSLVPVTDRQARAWYDSHIEDFRFASARQLASILIPVVPTSADSAAHRAKIEAARSTIMNAPVTGRAAVVTEMLKGLPRSRFPEQMVNILQVPKEIRDSLRRGKVGDVIGPFSFDREDVLFVIEDTVSTQDTVIHARHILMKVKEGNIEEDTTIRNLMGVMRSNIAHEQHFLQGVQFYSQDGSSTRGGDLGFFTRGTMVPEFDSAAYNAPVGKAVGPFRTQYGYHLIWVIERVTAAYKIRELRFPFAPSPAAMEAAQREAVTYAEAVRDNRATDSLFFEFKARYPGTVVDTSLLHRLDVYGDALMPANFAFNADSGDVGVFALPAYRVMISKLIYAYPTGIAPYEKIRIKFVLPAVERERQLDLLKPAMQALADTMTPEMTLGNIRLSAPWAEAYMVQDQYLASPPDEDTTMLDSCLEVARDGSVCGPVRGKHGYYFLRVVKKTHIPTAADFARERESFTREFLDRYREKLFTEMMVKAREYAVVDDLRPGVPGGASGQGRSGSQ
jgi:peptidyl-prolyl cis-trans isomerase D